MLTRGVVAITLSLALLGCQQNGLGQRAIAVRTLAFAPVTRAMPGVRLGPAGEAACRPPGSLGEGAEGAAFVLSMRWIYAPDDWAAVAAPSQA